MTDRISRDEEGLLIAQAAKARANCTRRQVGAVVMSPDGSIVATGRNGLASGRPGCLTAGACPRGQMSYPDAEQPLAKGDKDPEFVSGDAVVCPEHTDAGFGCTRDTGHVGGWHVACGHAGRVIVAWPAAVQPADTGYEATGCRAIHAEANALLRAGRDRTVGATLYVTEDPCFGCSVLIEGAGIARVVTPGSPGATDPDDPVLTDGQWRYATDIGQALGTSDALAHLAARERRRVLGEGHPGWKA